MIFFNTQWQGAGMNDALRLGAELLKNHFDNWVEIPLSLQDLGIKNNIIAYDALLEQMKNTYHLITEHQASTLFTIGGDCGVEVLPVSYLNEYYSGEMGLIWLDAHADLNTPESSPSKTFHGMPLRLILGEGDPSMSELLFRTLDPQQVFLLGVRETDDPEAAYIQSQEVYHNPQADYPNLKQELEARNFKKLYVHFDLDVIDPQEFAQVMCPTPEGLSIQKVSELLETLAQDFDIVGLGLTESTAIHPEQIEPIRGILALIKKIIED